MKLSKHPHIVVGKALNSTQTVNLRFEGTAELLERSCIKGDSKNSLAWLGNLNKIGDK